jgi:methyl-accepting chemotaxis protein
LRDIGLGGKFAALGLIGALLFAVPFVFYARDAAEVVRTSRQEQAGLAPAKALLRVVQLTQQHRGLFTGGLNEARATKQVEADRAYATLGAMLQSGGGPLAAGWSALADEWSALTREIAAGKLPRPEGFARHTALIVRELQLLGRLAEHYGLAYDSDPVAHHLVAATLVHLPAVTEELGKARARGSAYLAAGELNPVEQSVVSAFAQTARVFAANSTLALEKAVTTEPTLGPALAQPLRDASQEAARAFGVIEQEILRASAPGYAAASYFQDMTRAIDAQFTLLAHSTAHLERVLSARVTRQERTVAGALAGMLLLFAAVVVLARLIVRSITVPLRAAVQVAMQVAQGDLTARLEARGRDEIGQLQAALGDMTQNLRRLLGEVTQGARTVADTSAQIAQGNLDLSQRTEEQASTLEETASSMEELTSTVTLNADHAREASELAAAASQVARRGGTVVGDVVRTMSGISDASRRIAEIIGVIDGIAFQTNILALNAAVEAARAGEQGRGFAVVAAEVRNLAQRSASAAREIKDLIEASVGRVDAGARLVDAAGSTMQDIVVSVQKVSELIAEIAAASREQSSGIAQVNVAVTQMDQVVQQNASLVEEASAATEAMKDQSATLLQMVARFRLEAANDAARLPALPQGGRAEWP